MEEYNLNQTVEKLRGPSKEHLIVHNQWAAIGLDKFHQNSTAEFVFDLEGVILKARLNWNSDFPKSTMKEEIDIANLGGVALAWFVMSVLLNFAYVEQSEIGDGVDYRFKKAEPADDDLNFFEDYHYVEISGIMQESKTNTLKGRIKDKHAQINRGGKRDKPSSVIVTLFNEPITVKEIHR
jgi:hypothetical protein